MYNQVPQQPTQVPYLQPVAGFPQQGSSLDEASKLIDLVDRIAQRQSGAGNPAPGTSQYSPMNAGQFQSRNPQEIALQEMLLRNPQLLQQYQLQQQQQQSQSPDRQQGGRTFTQQEVEQIKQATQQMFTAANQHYQQLQQLWAMTQQIMIAYNAISEYAKELENAATLGYVANVHANAFLNELNAAHDVVNIQHQMLTTPLYLLPHSFRAFNQEVQPGDKQAVDLISDYYLEFIRNFEEKQRQSLGQYSPQYTEYLQQKMNEEIQQKVVAPQNQMADAAVQFAQGLQSRDFGQNLKRQHTQRLVALR